MRLGTIFQYEIQTLKNFETINNPSIDIKSSKLKRFPFVTRELFLHLMDPYTFAILILNLALLYISTVVILKPLFSWRILWCIILVQSLAAYSPIFLFSATDSPSIALYFTPSLYVSAALWESRTFIIDSFSYVSSLIFKPCFVCFPLSVLLVAFRVLRIDKDVDPLILVTGGVVGILLPEALYSFSKRSKILCMRSPRRGSIQRVSAMSSALVSPMNSSQIPIENIRV